jgi:hypothetical protein
MKKTVGRSKKISERVFPTFRNFSVLETKVSPEHSVDPLHIATYGKIL